jgi:uncharacterized RDD family membrane protein YckC
MDPADANLPSANPPGTPLNPFRRDPTSLDQRSSGASAFDQISIDTPELVAIEMPLAGIGSRFIALLVDYLILGAALIILVLLALIVLPALNAFRVESAQWAEAIVIFLLFLFNWGYFTLFEAFWNGRTPGKKAARIRVIQRSGRSIGLLESMARNLVRYVDQLPFFYAVGVITMFVTLQHQRLGDLAAGTLVVRDREPDAPLWADSGPRMFTPEFHSGSLAPKPHTSMALDPSSIARLSAADLEVLEAFFARRLDMTLDTRRSLAHRIYVAIQSKTGIEPPVEVSAETFLEAVAHQLRDQIRLQ